MNYDELDRLVRKMRAASVSESDSPPRQVLTACPALRCLVMTVAGRDETEPDVASRGWLRTRAWLAVDVPGGQGYVDGNCKRKQVRVLEPLSDYEAKRIIEDEDLGLPEAWEVRVLGISSGRNGGDGRFAGETGVL